MLGLLGSVLGSVTSGLFGLFGQNSANEQNLENDSTKYQRASIDMQKAGLNPAAMYNGGTPGAPPQMQNSMAPMANALKDAASSASQIMVANKTIDKMADEMAKLKADTAMTKAGVPGVEARSALDVIKTDAVKQIPLVVRTPLVQAGFGADTMRSAGVPAAIGGGAAASAKTVAKNLVDTGRSGLSGPTSVSARAKLEELANSFEHKWPALRDAIAKHLKPYPRKNTTVIYKQ